MNKKTSLEEGERRGGDGGRKHETETEIGRRLKVVFHLIRFAPFSSRP